MNMSLPLIVLLMFVGVATSIGETRVSTREALIEALDRAKPGDVIAIASGNYAGGIRVEALRGTAEAPIRLVGDAKAPPVFAGGTTGFHFSRCAHIHISHIVIRGATSNGLNVDDGGKVDEPTHHFTIEDVSVLETGPKGNRDGMKFSGLDHFVVKNCRITGWGGSAIDMVGCHHGVVSGCEFRGVEGFSQSNAVQMKGGSRDLRILRNHFQDVGHRSINLGGHTGKAYFRPAAGDYEATQVEVAGNHFIGSMAPITWASAKGGHVHHNTILNPDKWVLRILQENDSPEFAPCQGGRFENNVILYDRNVTVPVNVGGGTSPETFVFKNNFWLTPSGRPPSLPSTETDGAYGAMTPQTDLEQVVSEQVLHGRGAGAFREEPLFTCDFEAPTWFAEWGASKAGAMAETINQDDERRFEPHAGKALRIKVGKGSHKGASFQYNFMKQLGEEPEEIYFRYYLRFADDWKPERGGKLPGIGGTYGRAGWGGRAVDGTDGWSARGLFEGMLEGKTPIGYYCYHADMKRKYGSHWQWDKEDRGLLENNRWYCVEQHAKMNTPGKNDGILRGWVDGELAFERTDVRMRDVDHLKIETIWLNVYYGGSWTAKADYHLYIDDVVVAGEPIGPRRINAP